MKKQRTQLIAGILLSVFFLWLAFRKVDFRTLVHTLKNINYWWTIPFVFLTLLSMYIRTMRWHYIFLPRYNIGVRRLFPPLIIGFAFNSIFPARAGEFARAYIGARRENMGFSTMFATVIVERIFDGITIVILFTLGLIFLPPFDPSIKEVWDAQTQISGTTLIYIISVTLTALIFLSLLLIREGVWFRKNTKIDPKQNPIPNPILRKIAASLGAVKNSNRFIFVFIIITAVSTIVTILLLSGLLINASKVFTWGKIYTIDGTMLQNMSKRTALVLSGLVIILVLILINKTRKLIQFIVMKTPFIPHPIKQSMSRILDKFSEGLSALQSGKAFVMIIFYSFLVWILVGLSLQVMSFGFQDVAMNFWQAMLIVVIICVTISIPAAPGYWGLYEFGCILALSLLGIQKQREVSLSFSLIIHAGQMFPIIVIGLYYAIREHVSYQTMAQQIEHPQTRV